MTLHRIYRSVRNWLGNTILRRIYPVPLRIHGFWFRGCQLRFAVRPFEPEIVNLIRRHVTGTMRVADVGAAFGYHTLLLARHAKEVIAFEPDLNLFPVLLGNIGRNKLRNVVPLNVALGDKSGLATLFTPPDRKGISSLFPGRGSEERTIYVTTLDDVGGPFDFMKIDVEGAEIAVLRGARKALRPGAVVTLEMSSTWFQKRQEDPQRFLDELRNLGFHYRILLADGTAREAGDAEILERCREKHHINIYAQLAP